MPQPDIFGMYQIEEIRNKIIQGDILEILHQFPEESIDCIVTSPPYYAKRDYQIEKQIGLEKTLDEYIEKILAITEELKRILKPEGTFFLNLGDTYFGSHQGFGLRREIKKKENLTKKEVYFEKYKHTIEKPPPNAKSRIPAKSMMAIPWRIAIAMIDEQNWILRNDCIWFKSNALPESVKDRFSVKHEYVFFFVKNRKYYFNLDAVREPLTESTLKRILGAWKNSKWTNVKKFSFAHFLNQPIEKYTPPRILHQSGKEKSIIRDYFEKERKKYLNNFVGLNGQGGQLEFGGINSQNSTYREKLREYAYWYFNIREKHDWTNKKLIDDKQQLIAGMQYKRLTKGLNEAFKPENLSHPFGKNPGTIWKISTAQTKLWHFAIFPMKLVERCILAGCPEKGLVLDPFIGSGTTAVVAKKLGRDFCGIDIKTEYVEMVKKRLEEVGELLFK